MKKVKDCVSGMVPLKGRTTLKQILASPEHHIIIGKGVQIEVADLPGVFAHNATPQQHFQRRIAAAFQELECNTILYRLRKGLELAKEKMKQSESQTSRGSRKNLTGNEDLPTRSSIRRSVGGDLKVNGRLSHLEKLEKESALTPEKKQVLKKLCLRQEQGEFGWRHLAKKLSEVLKLCKPMCPEAARTLSASLRRDV
eukprot:1151163-Amphidinium_carterae.2